MRDWEAEDRIWRLRMRQEDRRSATLRVHRYVGALALGAWAAWGLGYVPAGLPEPKTPVRPPAALTPAYDALAAQAEMDAALLAAVAKQEDAGAAEAVAWVVLNRAGCEIRPEGFTCARPFLAVITEGRAFGTWRAGRWTPSWGREWSHPLDVAELAEVEGEVTAVLLGYVPDPTGGATHFHRLGTWTPGWAPAPSAWRILGAHAFYREKPARGVKR